MKYLLLFEKFINSPYITSNSNVIDPLIDFNDHLIQNDKNVQYITNYLNRHGYLKSRRYNDSLIKLYHGTSPKIPILEQGIKTTKRSTSHSFQVENGYTYFSIYPDMSKTFGDIGFGINNSVIYECLIPVSKIKPDKDQLINCKIHNPDVGNSIGDSIIYGHGVRVKGDIPPYMIKIYKK